MLKYIPKDEGQHELIVNIMDIIGNFKNYKLQISVKFDMKDLLREEEMMAKLLATK